MDASPEEDPLLQLQHGPIPRKRFNLVYFIFYLLGLGSLTPWNFFITASEYFKYKLRNTTLPADDFLNPSDETQLQAMSESYLTVASTLPNLVFNFITAALIQSWWFNTWDISIWFGQLVSTLLHAGHNDRPGHGWSICSYC